MSELRETPATPTATRSRARDEPRDVVITHPNRDSSSARGMRALTVAALLASAILMLIITIGGWDALSGAIPLTFAIIIITLFFAYRVSQWGSGALPVAAGLATASGLFAAVSIQTWFNRDDDAFSQPMIDEQLIGVLVVAYTILQVAVIVICLRAFSQQWQVELEVPRDEYERTN